MENQGRQEGQEGQEGNEASRGTAGHIADVERYRAEYTVDSFPRLTETMLDLDAELESVNRNVGQPAQQYEPIQIQYVPGPTPTDANTTHIRLTEATWADEGEAATAAVVAEEVERYSISYRLSRWLNHFDEITVSHLRSMLQLQEKDLRNNNNNPLWGQDIELMKFCEYLCKMMVEVHADFHSLFNLESFFGSGSEVDDETGDQVVLAMPEYMLPEQTSDINKKIMALGVKDLTSAAREQNKHVDLFNAQVSKEDIEKVLLEAQEKDRKESENMDADIEEWRRKFHVHAGRARRAARLHRKLHLRKAAIDKSLSKEVDRLSQGLADFIAQYPYEVVAMEGDCIELVTRYPLQFNGTYDGRGYHYPLGMLKVLVDVVDPKVYCAWVDENETAMLWHICPFGKDKHEFCMGDEGPDFDKHCLNGDYLAALGTFHNILTSYNPGMPYIHIDTLDQARRLSEEAHRIAVRMKAWGDMQYFDQAHAFNARALINTRTYSYIKDGDFRDSFHSLEEGLYCVAIDIEKNEVMHAKAAQKYQQDNLVGIMREGLKLDVFKDKVAEGFAHYHPSALCEAIFEDNN